MSNILKKSVAATVGALLTLVIFGIAAIFVLSALGIARIVPVLSNSMAPDMPKGSLAVMLPLQRDSVAAGDIIVFTAPDGSHRRVIHRVHHVYGPNEANQIRDWSTDQAFLLTKGDNNPQTDPWILTLGNTTLWKQTAVVPVAGWPAIWLVDPTTRIIAFMLGGAAVAVWALITIWRREPADESGENSGNDLGNEPDGGAMPVTSKQSEEVPRQ